MGDVCPDCRRRFGGSRAYQLHAPRRLGRCLEPPEMKRRGLHYVNGAWRQATLPPALRPLTLFRPEHYGSTPIEARRRLSEQTWGVPA